MTADITWREMFQARAQSGATPGDVMTLAKRISDAGDASDQGDRFALAAVFAHVAFAAPERLVETYDAAARGWLGDVGSPRSIVTPTAEPVRIDPALWTAFWSLLDDAGRGAVGAEITPRTAALGAWLSDDLRDRSAAAALTYPGVSEAATRGYPPRMTLEALALCPAGSLGHEFYRLIVDNGFDLEVLDREALGLSGLKHPLDYLNARILQCHDLWHIVAGYRTTALHEVAISAFQLAQFGHGYSAVFLAVMATTSALREPGGHRLIMDVILTAWRHGRTTPPLIGIVWEDVWDQTTDGVRARFGIVPYVSPWPADLFEALRAA